MPLEAITSVHKAEKIENNPKDTPKNNNLFPHHKKENQTPFELKDLVEEYNNKGEYTPSQTKGYNLDIFI